VSVLQEAADVLVAARTCPVVGAVVLTVTVRIPVTVGAAAVPAKLPESARIPFVLEAASETVPEPVTVAGTQAWLDPLYCALYRDWIKGTIVVMGYCEKAVEDFSPSVLICARLWKSCHVPTFLLMVMYGTKYRVPEVECQGNCPILITLEY